LQVGVPIAQRAERLWISRPARRYAAVLFIERCRLKIAAYAPQPPIRATGWDF
jgi:hypothetical protein